MPSATRVLPERTWWIEPGHVLGGAYPGDLDPQKARSKLLALLDLGIVTFVNLMEPEERGHGGIAFEPYVPVAEALARARRLEVECARFPIADLDVPSVDRMRAIQFFIDEHRARGRRCFVHCWGGRGRTGTVAGVYLIRHGLATPDDFVDVIRNLRDADAGGGRAPETAPQCEFVRRYPFRDP